ncbi:hypothetical protein MNBD_GAMMA12-2241 [hydrothermal vent metagenome]|uniref:Uncharacterized protein n=1 Tax=hydrothermal vent metagenome TaxID=652676 RepID=A0A3B0YYI9_9ZZZZ
MHNKNTMSLKKSISTLIIGASITASYSAFAVDYEVISGTFFMDTVTLSPTSVFPLPATNLTNGNGFFSENQFDGSSPQANKFFPASGGSPAFTISPDATITGFNPFLFFGQPVNTYFASTGIDNTAHAAPTIDITGGTTDLSSFYANWNGTEFNQGNKSNTVNPTTNTSISDLVTVTDNGDTTFTLSWSSLIIGGAFNGKVGDWTMDVCVSPCVEVSDAPAGTLSAVQTGNANSTRTITTSGGNVTLFTDIGAPFTYNWGSSSPEIIAAIDTTPPASSNFISQFMVIDPSSLTPGQYTIKVFTKNTTITPNEASSNTMILNVVTDFSGLDLLDNDNDGIPNENDTISDTTMLQTVDGNNTTFIMQSSAGNLKLGRTAFCSGSLSATLTAQDIIDNGNNCSPVTNAVDNPLSVTTGIGGYYDFEIDGLTAGATVDISIPLNTTIPANAGWRKYSTTTSWLSFDFTGNNKIASAKAISNGICPPLNDSTWTNSLTPGDNCIKLSIVDGGPNDSDGKADGIVRDPGSLSNFQGLDKTSPRSTSVGALWWLLLTPGILLIRKLKKFF